MDLKSVDIEKQVEECQRKLFGERYVGASISKIVFSNNSQQKIDAFQKIKKNFLVFCGNPGIGKTYLCAALMDWVLKNFNTFRYHTESKIFQSVRDSISKYETGDYIRYLETLIDDDLIILDDVGSQGVNDWREEVFFNIVDYRYNSMKPTVFTSNLTRKEFRNKYHERVCSRLFSNENIIIDSENISDLRMQGY